jgi:hypothetical protein
MAQDFKPVDRGKPKRRLTDEEASLLLRRMGRKAPGGRAEPNDRKYSHKAVKMLRRMKATELDQLLNAEK